MIVLVKPNTITTRTKEATAGTPPRRKRSSNQPLEQSQVPQSFFSALKSLETVGFRVLPEACFWWGFSDAASPASYFSSPSIPSPGKAFGELASVLVGTIRPVPWHSTQRVWQPIALEGPKREKKSSDQHKKKNGCDQHTNLTGLNPRGWQQDPLFPNFFSFCCCKQRNL